MSILPCMQSVLDLVGFSGSGFRVPLQKPRTAPPPVNSLRSKVGAVQPWVTQPKVDQNDGQIGKLLQTPIFVHSGGQPSVGYPGYIPALVPLSVLRRWPFLDIPPRLGELGASLEVERWRSPGAEFVEKLMNFFFFFFFTSPQIFFFFCECWAQSQFFFQTIFFLDC